MAYSFRQLERFWIDAGGDPELAPEMAAIGLAESRGQNVRQRGQPLRRTGWGIWQITPGNRSLLDPQRNARAAVRKETELGLGAWTTYTSGAYRDFLPTGGAGVPTLGHKRGRLGPGSGSAPRTGDAFVQSAAGYIGRPYVWGGDSPKGFDCSGLVEYVLSNMGLRNVPRTSEAQYAWTDRVPPDQLQAGDLVFLNFPGEVSPGHVMIYAGGGEVIQAPRPGQTVQESRFDPQKPGSNEWGATVVGYGRVPGLSYTGEPAGGLSGPVVLPGQGNVPGQGTRPNSRPGTGDGGGGWLGDAWGGFEGAVSAGAGDVGSLFGDVTGLISGPLDFLKAALWLVNPLNWLRAFEALVGVALIAASVAIFVGADKVVEDVAAKIPVE